MRCNKQLCWNLAALVLLLVTLGLFIGGLSRSPAGSSGHADPFPATDASTIDLPQGRVEVVFSDVLLSPLSEERKLIVFEQSGTVSTELTDRIIRSLDFSFLKKTQTVSYTGTGYFVVDLDRLTPADIRQDSRAKTVTIAIPHPRLDAIEIRPNDIVIDEVKEGLLARGDIKLTVADYTAIEAALRTRLEERFNTVANGQSADALALEMVKDIYAPAIQAVDRRYTVEVVFR